MQVRGPRHAEPRPGVALVEALGRGPLEKDDLGGAGKVAAVGLGEVDVRGVDAADVADRGEELRRGEGGREAGDEEGAVLVRGDRGRAVALEVRVAALVGGEALDHEVHGGDARGLLVEGAGFHGVEDGVGGWVGGGEGGEGAGWWEWGRGEMGVLLDELVGWEEVCSRGSGLCPDA